jgi:anti-sigma factor RsiW
MMGGCESVSKLLSPYVDDELLGSERAVVDDHLKSCSDCQKRLVDLRATQAAMQAFITQRAEGVDFSGFTAKVMSQIKKEPLPLGQRLKIWWTEVMAYNATAVYSGFGAAGVAAIAVLAFVAIPRGPHFNNELVVHSLKVSDPRYEPVVMHTDDGETVIMLVEHVKDDDDSKASSGSTGGNQQVPEAEGELKGEPQTDPPHGGNL